MDAPPSYDCLYTELGTPGAYNAQSRNNSAQDGRHPIEEFAIDDSLVLEEDPLNDDNSDTITRRQRLREAFRAYRAHPLDSAGRAVSGLCNSITRLASSAQDYAEYAVSPITKPWNAVVRRLDNAIDGIINPLLVHRLLFLGAVFAGLYAFYNTWDQTPSTVIAGGGASSGAGYLPQSFINEYLREHIDPEHIKRNAQYFDTIPHAAGSRGGVSIARHVDSTFRSYGLQYVGINTNPAYITRRKDTTLRLFGGDNADTVIHTTKLLEGDANLGRDGFVRQTPAHMSLSQGGYAKGHLLYANFGSASDLSLLEKSNVNLHDAIVIVKFGQEERPGTVAKRLEFAGAKGVIFFSHKTPGFDTWPQGPDYSEDAVQRGSVGLPEIWPGDLLSPGWPSTSAMTVSNFDAVRNVVKIPVVSSSWKDIAPFLQSLDGHGVRVDNWHNNGYPKGVEHWFTGSSDNSAVTVELDVQVEVDDRRNTHNIVSRIEARDDQEHAIILGARLDSYCAGGSSMSGLAMLVEIARALSLLAYEHNWLPLRPIYFMAWDGTSSNFAGVTEYAEVRQQQLRRNGLVYIDLDEVVGDQLRIEGTPSIMLDEALKSVSFNGSHSLSDLAHQPSTQIGFENGLISSLPHWAHFENAEAFSSYALVPSVRLRLDSNLPVPRDSCFDSTSWTSQFGDSTYQGHRAIAELAARLAVQYADLPIIQYSFARQVSQLKRDYAATKELLKDKLDLSKMSRLDLKTLDDVIESWSQVASTLDGQISRWQQQFRGEFDAMGSTAREPRGSRLVRENINNKLSTIFQTVYSTDGIPGRPWYHTKLMGITGSGKAASFGLPSLRDAASDGSLSDCKKAIIRLINGVAALEIYAKSMIVS